GGPHQGQPTDFVEPYLRQVLGFLGITEIEVVRADSVGLSPQHRWTSIANALAALPEPSRRAAWSPSPRGGGSPAPARPPPRDTRDAFGATHVRAQRLRHRARAVGLLEVLAHRQ